jgi:TBC1 domain family member 10
MPKLYEHMISAGFMPQMYASQWFLTCFAVYFEMDVVVRIWDVYLVEGRKTIFRVGLAILKLLEKRLMAGELGEMFVLFRDFRNEVDVEVLLNIALNEFTFSKSALDKLEKEHREKPNEEIFAHAKML